MRRSARRLAAVLGSGIAGIALAAAAHAQAPPPLPPEAAHLAECLCLKAATDRLGADMAGRQNELETARRELARLTSELERERGAVDINNPQSVSRFRQLLVQRDAAFNRVNGPLVADTQAVVQRYNAQVGEYNGRCANRPMDPVLIARVQATLSCPPL